MIGVRAVLLLCVVVAAACGGKSARTPRVVRPDEPRAIRQPNLRPLRLIWSAMPPTLEQRASIEPHFRISSPWWESCERRGRLHDDALAYVEAWCRYRIDPRFDLARALSPMRRSPVPKLGAAIELDVINYIADTQNARDAFDWLAYGGRDDYEQLVALYLEYGRFDDATQIANAYRARWRTPSCTRDLFDLIFELRPSMVRELPASIRTHGTASRCGQRFLRAACLVQHASVAARSISFSFDDIAVASECAGIVFDTEELTAKDAVTAWLAFQTPHANIQLEIAKLATGAAALVPDAYDLALAALEYALLLGCNERVVGDVRNAANKLAASERQSTLATMTVERCSGELK